MFDSTSPLSIRNSASPSPRSVGPPLEERPPLGLVVGDVEKRHFGAELGPQHPRDGGGEIRVGTAGGRDEDP